METNQATPRTDSVLEGFDGTNSIPIHAMAALARQLERELAEAKSAVNVAMQNHADAENRTGEIQAMFRTRVGDSLEVLDGIREALAGQDKDQILELVNGYIDRAQSDLEKIQ